MLIKEGGEFGTTTGRMRKTNWLNLDKLIKAVNISGTTNIIISKVDIIEKIKLFKLYHNSSILSFNSIIEMKDYISNVLSRNCSFLEKIIYSDEIEMNSLLSL